MNESIFGPPPETPNYCPIEIAFHEFSLVMGGKGRLNNPDLLVCPEDCPGTIEVTRATFSPLRIIYGSTKIACGQKQGK